MRFLELFLLPAASGNILLMRVVRVNSKTVGQKIELKDARMLHKAEGKCRVGL